MPLLISSNSRESKCNILHSGRENNCIGSPTLEKFNGMFRWLSLMLSQEFSLPDVLTLWDALLTDDSRSVTETM